MRENEAEAGTQQPRQFTREDFKSLVEGQPGKRLRLWIVFAEDRYESAFGDGRYTYPWAAFFTQAAADRCAEWVRTTPTRPGGTCWFGAEALPVDVVQDDEENLTVPHPKSKAMYNWEEIALIKLINGKEPDFRPPFAHKSLVIKEVEARGVEPLNRSRVKMPSKSSF